MLVQLLALIFALCMLVALFVGGAQPIAVGLFPAPWDKLAHASFFLVLSILMARFVSLPYVLVLVLAMLVGAGDEIHQSFLPGRVAGLDDWLADVVGSILGLTLCKWLSYRRSSKTT